MHMPEGILSPETAILGFNIRTFLDSAFAFTNSNVFQPQVVRLEQWAFALKVLILY
jgi:hypothetical protein